MAKLRKISHPQTVTKIYRFLAQKSLYLEMNNKTPFKSCRVANFYQLQTNSKYWDRIQTGTATRVSKPYKNKDRLSTIMVPDNCTN